MILTMLLIGAIVGGGVAISAFWQDIVNFSKRAYDRLSPEIKNQIQGFVSVMREVKNAIVEEIKDGIKRTVTKLKNFVDNLYYKYNPETQTWTEIVVTKEIDASQVPEHIRNKLKISSQVDVSEELQKNLELVNT